MPPTPIRFEPTEYSIEELRFLLPNLEKPPVIMRDMPLPSGVVRAQVLKIVTDCFELQQKFAAAEVPWAGYDKVRESIERTLNWYQTTQELARRGGPKHASMQTWDGNRYMPRGVGSDSGTVKTEILPDGSRRPLGLNLVAPDGKTVGPDLVGAAPWLDGPTAGKDLLASTPSALIVTDNAQAQSGTVQCPICDWTESYALQKSGSKNMAIARMKRHLKHAKTNKDRHAILYGRITGRSQAA